MQQKRRLTVILKKASRLLKVPILVSRMRTSVNIPRLISVQKSSKKMKKFILLRHYNYNYVHEYQFSPSNSPLSLSHSIYRRAAKKRRYEEICSIFPIGNCLGVINKETENRGYPLMELKAVPYIENSITEELYDDSEEDRGDVDSIDERAEKFIERFYEEIRMQRKESQSLVHSNPVILDLMD
ncbi:OLC1v1032245C1 [Oldenlandia corymbosa var. corymbosa]|uniref:OLC1v1032245C1 n=1 Tax=Oldenlandia corymbosa var. corymbosa TaxID=529605 RepID=A0AAV1CKM1_OLDCO|nr:OLC1v1032245C1 [Oldenlandia corymbosa var. corymbosa]